VYAKNIFPRLAKAIHAPSEVYSIRFYVIRKVWRYQRNNQKS